MRFESTAKALAERMLSTPDPHSALQVGMPHCMYSMDWCNAGSACPALHQSMLYNLEGGWLPMTQLSMLDFLYNESWVQAS